MIVDFGLVVVIGFLGGLAARWLKQPTVIGYLGAGFITTLFFPEIIKHRDAIDSIAQIGVALLLFTLGIELNLNRLNRVIKIAVFGGIIGALVVMAFMVFYYRLFGVFASLALLIYIALTLAVFKGMSMTMNLSGIAGFILSIGMAVDANILIFERTKEEIKNGLSKIGATEEGFRRAWPSIRDSNIATIITSIILYYSATSFVKGFALALLMGVLVSMFSAITITRTMLRVFMK